MQTQGSVTQGVAGSSPVQTAKKLIARWAFCVLWAALKIQEVQRNVVTSFFLSGNISENWF